ncbi:hypothetical protein PHSC3_001673 [Chlamydiales bacterium STE3]|nr:hypothetical protein PHSC3_001673 [Chlamydiales bacterium STE3]
MKKPTSLSIIRPLLAQPSFTADEVKPFGISSAHLGYYIRKGLIRRLGRGIYQGADYQESPENFRWEDLIETVNSVPNGVICLISALAIYDLTEEIPREHWIEEDGTSIFKQRFWKFFRILFHVFLKSFQKCFPSYHKNVHQ